MIIENELDADISGFHLNAGFPGLDGPTPCRGGRSLRFGFPPR
jgi:hypothetical protein